MSAVRTMQSLSILSSLKAKFWTLVRLGLGDEKTLGLYWLQPLSSSVSCWLNLVQAASMAVIYSKLGGCLGATANLGPLAKTDLCAGVKGLLDRLMTHLGLGSSREDPWGSLWGVRCGIAILGTSTVCLGGSTVPLGILEGPLPGWMSGCCLLDLVTWLPAWPAWEEFSPAGERWAPAWQAGEATGLPPSSGEGEVTGLPATWEAWEAQLH